MAEHRTAETDEIVRLREEEILYLELELEQSHAELHRLYRHDQPAPDPPDPPDLPASPATRANPATSAASAASASPAASAASAASATHAPRAAAAAAKTTAAVARKPPGTRPLVTASSPAAAKHTGPARGGDNQRGDNQRLGPRRAAGRGVTWGEGGNQVACFTRGSSPRSFAKRAHHEEQRRLHRGEGDNQRRQLHGERGPEPHEMGVAPGGPVKT